MKDSALCGLSAGPAGATVTLLALAAVKRPDSELSVTVSCAGISAGTTQVPGTGMAAALSTETLRRAYWVWSYLAVQKFQSEAASVSFRCSLCSNSK